MTMYKLFPRSSSIPVHLVNILDRDEAGQYCPHKDAILLDESINKNYPLVSHVVRLHEMFHSTSVDKRTMRITRLVDRVGPYRKDSKSYRLEECIVEICTMVALKKLGLLSPYTQIVVDDGIKRHYANDLTIPWMEVTAALRYFAEDDEDFKQEEEEVKDYMIDKFNMKIGRTYDSYYSAN